MGAKLPRFERTEMVFLIPQQILTLADAIGPDFRLLVVFAGTPV